MNETTKILDWMHYVETPQVNRKVEKIDTILAKRMKEFMKAKKRKSL